MLVPLSWLKDYVDITLKPEELLEKLAEVGVGCENITKTGEEVIFEFEITPNRSDLLSVVGIAREIAAIEGKKIQLKTETIPKPTKILPFTIKNDFTLLEHYVSVVIANVTVKDSPGWMKERLKKVGLRAINNIVDVTNYVMFELGIPLHAFDYDEAKGAKFAIEKSKGGEKFVSVDELSYTLPKDAIIIRDEKRVVDLVGIKGGLNSGIREGTKNVLLQTSSDNPVLIRRASQNLSLRSDASNILEKGIDKNGLLPALARAANLILDLSGGSIASKVYDLKKHNFAPWKLTVRLGRVKKLLGIQISTGKTLNILERLNLSPKIKKDIIAVTVPTYRNDLQIEEDIIEEIARHYGYNKLSQTLPSEEIPVKETPYFKNHRLEERIKTVLIAAGFSEIYSYSLVSEKDILSEQFNPLRLLRVDNSVSREYEYLRPTLLISLKKALKQNLPYTKSVNLFEFGKAYLGHNLDEASEPYFLSGISSTKSFREVKGVLEAVFKELGINDDPSSYLKMTDEGTAFEINLSNILENARTEKIFKPIPQYPPVIEDLAIIISKSVPTGEIIKTIYAQSRLIAHVDLLDRYDMTRTFHIVYQHTQSNLTNPEVTVVRNKILKTLKEKFNARLKE